MTRFSVFATLSAIGLFGASCSPLVRTTVSQHYPVRETSAPVVVYEISDQIPENAEMIGNVTVKDGGFATGCGYEEVLGLAIRETNKAGGNGFHLTYHREPSLWGSSCHRIGGNILLLPTSTDLGELTEGASTEDPAEQLAQPKTFRVAATNASVKKTDCAFYVNAGYGFVTNKMYYGNITKGNPKQGLDLNAGIDFFSPKGLGGGIRYAGFFSSFDSQNIKSSYQVHYLAPEFAISATTRNNKWVFRETIGIGFASYSEKYGDIGANCT